MILEEKEIQELGEFLNPYTHLSNLNISKNEIRDIDTVSNLPHLLTFSASGCAIKSLDFMSANPQSLQYLQWLDLSINKITELPGLRQPQLCKVNLSENAIASTANFNGHTKIMVLNLSKNKMVNCEGLCHMTALEDLNLSENEINNTEELKNMPSLTNLNLNTNKLTTMAQLPALPSLDNLDVGANVMEKAVSIAHLA